MCRGIRGLRRRRRRSKDGEFVPREKKIKSGLRKNKRIVSSEERGYIEEELKEV